MIRGLVALLSGACLWAASPAQAQPLAQADAAFERAEIVEAAAGYQAALETGELRGDELVRAYLRSGVLAMWTGDDDAAQRNLRIALSLHPDLAPPPELSPAQQRALRVIRAEIAERPPLGVEVEPAEGERAVVRVTGPALSGLRVRAVARDDTGTETHRQIVGADPRIELALPAVAWGNAVRTQLEVELLDPYGNTMRSARATLRRVASPAEVAQAGGAPTGATGPSLTEVEASEGGGDDGPVIALVTTLIALALAGAGAAIGYAVWDAQPWQVNFVAGSP